MINFELQNHKPLREIVYEELKRQILVGEILPGTRMMEVELADSMGVSRTPVREAIRKLEKEGLVVIEPRRGAYASDISIKELLDVLEVRRDLEGLAASLASKSVSEDEKNEFVRINAAYKKAIEDGNTEDMIEYDSKFHRLIGECSGNGALTQVLSQIQELSLRFRYLYYDDFTRYEHMPMEHEAIEEAILSGDADRARSVSSEHIEKLKVFVEEAGKKMSQEA